MAFDINTARPVEQAGKGGGFDINTAKPYREPQESAQPVNKDEAIKKGFGLLKDMWQGNAEYKDAGNAIDYLVARADAGFYDQNPDRDFFKDFNRISDAGTFGNKQDQQRALQEVFGDAEFNPDKGGNQFTEFNEKQFYTNKPGMDTQDVMEAIGEGITYSMGGAATAPVRGVLKKAGAGMLAQGTANVVNQKLAGRDEVDFNEAALTAATGGLFEGGGQLINKIRNAKAGKTMLDGDAQDVVDFVKKYGDDAHPLAYDDIAQNSLARTTGQQLDQIPIVGGAKYRQAQNAAQKAAAQNITAKNTLPDTTMDDLYDAVSAGAKNQLERSKQIASKKYDKVIGQLDESVGQFDAPELRQTARQIIDEQLAKGSAANKEVINAMQDYLDVPGGNFSHWKEIRTGIIDQTRDLEKSLAGKSKALEKALKRVSSAINSKLDDVAENSGEGLAKRWRDANKFYNDAVIRYTKPALKNAMKEDNPDKMLDLFLATGKAQDNKKMAQMRFNSLDKDGKAAVRQAMMQKAFDEALTDVGDFSAAKYATVLKRYENRLGVVLSKEDAKYIDGLTKYMRATQAASGYGRNTPTGQQVLPTLYGMAAASGTATNPVGTAGALMGVAATKKLFRTPRGRSFMLAMSSYPEGKAPPPQLLIDIARYLAVSPSEEQ